MTRVTPVSEDEAGGVVAEACARGTPLRLEGGGTQTGMGRPVDAATTLSSSALTGITLHEPAELVIGARSGTSLREIEAKLASAGQILPFEPIDLRPLYGTSGEPTIGGVVAGNWAGSRRILTGAARDHLIGARFVNGRGEIVKSGGRVMKNVTGLDLARLQCGAHGTLGFLTEVTFKVLPKAETAATLVYGGLDDRRAIDLLSIALTSPFEVSGAAHLPPGLGGAGPRTLLRLENFAASVDYRCERLIEMTSIFGRPDRLDTAGTDELWPKIGGGCFIAEPRERAVWRISVPPSDGPDVVGRLPQDLVAAYYYDWGGGLIWVAVSDSVDAGVATIRAAVTPCGGHATLIRASDETRASAAVFQPLEPALQSVTRRIKASFDPAGILNPGRMYAE